MINSFEKNVKNSIKWCLPHGLLDLICKHRKLSRQRKSCINRVGKKGLKFLANNSALKNIHSGERCFILGTGPSINKLDINLLKGERCIFLNQFYLHKEFKKLSPSYYLHAGIYDCRHISKEFGRRFYREMEKIIPNDCVMLLNCLDISFIIKNKLFRNHKVYYSLFKKDEDDILNHGIDMCGLLYTASNVITMALQIAFYMGFSEIYLLGFDGENDKSSGALHFYNESDDLASTPNRKIEIRNESWLELEKTFSHGMHFFRQLRALQSFAQQKEIKIYNATHGGIVDFFPRVKFESLF